VPSVDSDPRYYGVAADVTNLLQNVLSTPAGPAAAVAGAAKPIAAIFIAGTGIRLAKREMAEAMETAGRSAREIWDALQMVRRHGEWVEQISDAGFRVVPRGRDKSLFEHYVHPSLQEALPGLEKVQSHLRIRPSMEPKGYFEYAPGKPGKVWVRAPDLRTAEEVAIEEIQHAVQHHVGLPRGGTWPAFVNKGMSDANAQYEYWRLAGEAQARDAAYRLRMSEQERLARPPWTTERPPFGQQLVVRSKKRAE